MDKVTKEYFLDLRKKEKMSSKERVLTTFAHKEADRVPINYSANPGINAKLKKYFNLAENDQQGLREILGVDFQGIGAPYIGPRLHEEIEDRRVNSQWGYRTRWVEHGAGGYWDYCDFPLKDATEEEIANWPMPDPADFDYSQLRAACAKNKDYALHIGHPGLGCIINRAGFFRGMEQVFVDLATANPAGLLLIDRFLEIQFEITKKTLEKIGDLVDFMWMGEDLGTQEGPLISEKMFNEFILPRHKKFFDLAKSYNLPVMMHTCGSSSWTYEAYIKAGLSGVDTLQPEAKDMSPAYLKDKFAGRLFFHGCISTAGSVSFGTVEETIEDVKNTLDIMKPGGGYCFSPTHSLQDNSPVENVVAMYKTAHEYGKY